MPKVTFYYFPLKVLGEGIRLLLAYGGEEFEDRRVSVEQWPDVKSMMPFGQMPVLDIDGKQYAQCLSIARYLGRKYGLDGSNIEEDFEIDQNMEFWNDIRLKISAAYHETDEKVRARMKADFEENQYPVLLNKSHDIIINNNGHIAIGRLTWADFIFTGMYDCWKFNIEKPNLDETYPEFKKLQDKVLSIPKVKAYCVNAPKAPY